MLYAFLIILFSCLFLFLAWRNIVLATAVLVAFLPSYLIRTNLGPFPINLLEIMVLLLFFAWAIKQKGGIAEALKNLKSNRWLWLVAAWIFFATVSLFVSPNLRAAAGAWKTYFIEPVLFLLVFISVIKNKKDFELILYALGFSALYISAFAFYQKITGFAIPNPIWQAEETRRVTSFYGYPNAVGLYLAPIATLCAGWLIDTLQTAGHRLRKILFQLAVFFSSAAAIVFARSEGAYIGVLCGLFFLGIMTKKLRWPTVILAIIFIATVVLVPQFKNYAWQQIAFQNDSGKVRISQWQETWEMLRDRPITGTGLAGYQEALAPYHKAKHIEIYLYPHNLFLNFWSEIGLGGLIIFLTVVAKFFKDNLKKIFTEKSSLSIILSATMITLIIHGLVDVQYLKNDLSLFFWLLIGISVLVPKIFPKKTF